jgi:hypothetical protein
MNQGRRADLAACLLLLVLPAILLWPNLTGTRAFVPFDVAQFPPASTQLLPEQLAAIKAAQNADVSEVPLMFLPELRHARDELAQGRLPEWNPYGRNGTPLLAAAVDGLLYPPNWLLLLYADPQDGLGWLAWLALVVGELLTYGFLRELRLARAAALLGAVAFALGGTACANLHFYQRIDALIWLPGMLWAQHRITHGDAPARLRGLLGLAACTAMTWLAGFPPYAGAVTLTSGLFALGLVAERVGLHGLRALPAPLLLTGAGLALGFLLAAVQLWPMFEFFPHSNRSVAPGPDDLAAQAAAPYALLGYLFPDLFGHPATTELLPYGSSPLTWWLEGRRRWTDGRPLEPNFNYIEYTVYAGALALPLAFVGACLQRRMKLWLLAALAILWLLATGPWPVRELNQVAGLRNVPPLRFLGPCGLLVAWLAALGADALLRSDRRARRAAAVAAVGCGLLALLLWLRARGTSKLTPDAWWSEMLAPTLAHFRETFPEATAADAQRLVGVYAGPGHARALTNLQYAALAQGVAAACAALAAWLPSRRPLRTAFVLAAALGLAAELLPLGREVCRGRELPYPHRTPVHEFLRAENLRRAEQGGIMVARAAAQAGLPVALPPGPLLAERVRDLNAYTFVDSRSHLPWQRALGEGSMVRGFWVPALPDASLLGHPYLDLLGVRYLLSSVPLQHAGAQVGPRLAGPGGSFYVYERQSSLPRAFVVERSRTLADDAAILQALLAPDLDPRIALVTPDVADWLQRFPAEPGAAQRAVRFTQDHPGHVILDVGPGPRGWLLVSDTHMPGWTAQVNGRPGRLLRADLHLRLIPLPAERASVEMRYRTPGLVAGFFVTLLGLLVWLGIAWRLVAQAPAPSASMTTRDPPAV